MNISLENIQTQKLYQKMEISLSILAMDDLELIDYLNEQMKDNPLIEVSPPDDIETARRLALQKLERFRTQDSVERPVYDDADGTDNYIDALGISEENAYAYVKRQLDECCVSQKIYQCAVYLLKDMDDDGYIRKNPEKLANQYYSKDDWEQALTLLQSLEPAGVGARNLQECLILQLERQGRLDDVFIQIINQHLFDICRGKEKRVAQKLGITAERLVAYYETIKTLTPKPCISLNWDRAITYIKPDIIVKQVNGRLEIDLNVYEPQITLNASYMRILQETTDREAIQYILKQLKGANWLAQCIEKRRRTISSVMNEILEIQKDFFLYGKTRLLPMKMGEIAERVNIHESTVSRAIKGKYVLCDHGIYEIRKLFQRTNDMGSNVTQESVKHRISKIISEENSSHPLSDQKISEILLNEKINISRRTVTKYREQMDILPSYYRHKE